MLTYILLFCLGVFVLYHISTRFSGALVGTISGSARQHDIHELFFRTVFILLGYIAKRDGAVNAKEIKRTEVYMEKMDLDANHKREAIRLFKLGAQPQFNIKKTIEQFHWLAQKSPNLVQILLVYLINLARVDGLLVNKEIEAVEEVALGLGYSSVTFKHLLQMIAAQHKFGETLQDKNTCDLKTQKNGKNEKTTFNSSKSSAQQTSMENTKSCEEQTRDFNNRPDQLPAAYEVFDVSPSASDAEIKKAYRSMVNQYHPDKLIGLGLPPYMIQSATECFQKIQAAYDYIKKARQIS